MSYSKKDIAPDAAGGFSLCQQLGHVQASIEHLGELCVDLKAGQNVLHKRLTNLDKQVTLWKGGFAVLTIAATLVGSVLGHFIK